MLDKIILIGCKPYPIVQSLTRFSAFCIMNMSKEYYIMLHKGVHNGTKRK